MSLKPSHDEWAAIALVAGVVTFLSILMMGYLCYYDQPSFEDLSKREVIVSRLASVFWSRGSSPILRYMEVMAIGDNSREEARYVLSSEPKGFKEALMRNKGKCVLWFDSKQANEIFQIEVDGSAILKYSDVYERRSSGTRLWWHITLVAFPVGLLAFALSIVNMRTRG